MDEIKNLTEIIKHKSQRSLQLVNQNFRKKETSKDNLLFKGLVKEDFFNDEEASKKLFKSDPGNRNYRNAKAKLKINIVGKANNPNFIPYLFISLPDKNVFKINSTTALTPKNIPTKAVNDSLAGNSILA